jgi:hypothetical protein
MGKRELLLAAAFVLAGFLVYQFTAPPPDPNSKGFSLSGILHEVRREVRGQRETAESTQTLTRPAPAGLEEIRISLRSGPITVTGEDRTDIEAELHVRSNGYDKPEAERLAKATTLKFDEAGAVLIITLQAPVQGLQRPTLRLKVPARLGIRIDEKNGVLAITNVASVAMGVARGASTITTVRGLVSATQRGSTMTISDVGSVKLTTAAGANARVAQVRGHAAFTLQGGELRAEALAGGLEVEARGTEVQFDKLEALKGPVRVNANTGRVVFVGLRAETRIDGRQTEIRVGQTHPATLAIYNEGAEPIEVTLPPGGVRLDALAVNGRVQLEGLEQSGLTVETPAAGAEPAGAPREARVTGTVAGGGPTITLRSVRGDITIRGK